VSSISFLIYSPKVFVTGLQIPADGSRVSEFHFGQNTNNFPRQTSNNVLFSEENVRTREKKKAEPLCVYACDGRSWYSSSADCRPSATAEFFL
jgi:hypothetical protein